MKSHSKSILVLSLILAMIAIASVAGIAASYAGFARSQTVQNPETSSALQIGAEGARSSNS